MNVLHLSDDEILAARGLKNDVDPFRPYHFLTELEYSADGIVEDVTTIFLTNRECPFRCLMCDLWKNTTNETVAIGAIPEQIRYALDQLPPANHIKLYNSGNFFDAKAIPAEELPEISRLLDHFQTVIVENHPKLCNQRCLDFADRCTGQLEVALGLETSHEPTLRSLNKQMTSAEFASACEFLLAHGIRLRSFVLLRPPGVSETEAIEQAIESVKFAFNCGVNCCAVIPTRSGNGIMDVMQAEGRFSPPSLSSLETVIDETLAWNRGRVFADLWDAEQFADCRTCAPERLSRLQRMNLNQQVLPQVDCSACGGDTSDG